MSMTDHGNVTGDVSVDASTVKCHHFNLVDDDAVIGEPSGCSDGDTVILIFTCTAFGNHTATLNFNAYAETPNPRQGLPVKIVLTKFGTKWV